MPKRLRATLLHIVYSKKQKIAIVFIFFPHFLSISSETFPTLQAKYPSKKYVLSKLAYEIICYCNKYLCLFFDFHVPIQYIQPWCYFAYIAPTIFPRIPQGSSLQSRLRNLYCAPATQIGLHFFSAIFAMYAPITSGFAPFCSSFSI